MAQLTTPFSFGSTAADVIAGVDLAGKTMIVTGGNGGVGKEIVRALATARAEVVVAARDPAAAKPVLEDLREATGNVQIEVCELQLSDLASVSRFVETWNRPLDALVNNAGIMALATAFMGLTIVALWPDAHPLVAIITLVIL